MRRAEHGLDVTRLGHKLTTVQHSISRQESEVEKSTNSINNSLLKVRKLNVKPVLLKKFDRFGCDSSHEQCVV